MGGNNFNDFPEIVPTREITNKIQKSFLVFSSAAVGLFLEWAQCCSIHSTRLGPALRSIPRHCAEVATIVIVVEFAVAVG